MTQAGVNAAAWMARQSFHQILEKERDPQPTRILEMTIEQWDGTRFVERLVRWNEAEQRYLYAEATR